MQDRPEPLSSTAPLSSRWNSTAATDETPSMPSYSRCECEPKSLPGRCTVSHGGLDAGRLGPVLRGTIGIDYCWGRRLRARFHMYIVACIASALHLFFRCKTLYVKIGTQFAIFLYSEHLIHRLYVCTYEFSLHRECFDAILYDTVILRWGCYKEEASASVMQVGRKHWSSWKHAAAVGQRRLEEEMGTDGVDRSRRCGAGGPSVLTGHDGH
jgi:hypothetical protein